MEQGTLIYVEENDKSEARMKSSNDLSIIIFVNDVCFAGNIAR